MLPFSIRIPAGEVIVEVKSKFIVLPDTVGCNMLCACAKMSAAENWRDPYPFTLDIEMVTTDPEYIRMMTFIVIT